MALTLTLRPKQDVYVGDDRLVLQKIENMNKAVLHGPHGPTVITPFEWVTMSGLPGVEVMLAAGRDTNREHCLQEIRVQFNAPGLVVLRGNKYRNGKVKS